MNNCRYIPKGILQPYVKYIWYCNGYIPLSKKERVLPNGASQLIINLGSERFRHFEGNDCQKETEYAPAIITGIHTSNIFLDSNLRLSTMNVVLRPGALSALFDIPACEFTNQVVPLEAVTGSSIRSLRHQLIETTGTTEKFNLLETYLISRLDRSFQPNPAVIYSAKQFNNKNGILSVSEIRDKVGYSHRRFSELFKILIGITPKHYARICRFQHTLKSIREMKAPDWTAIALDSGYYDQPHLIHEFKTFAGISPTEYYHNQSNEINHLPA